MGFNSAFKGLNYTVAANSNLLTNRQSDKNAKWRWLICGFLTQVVTVQAGGYADSSTATGNVI